MGTLLGERSVRRSNLLWRPRAIGPRLEDAHGVNFASSYYLCQFAGRRGVTLTINCFYMHDNGIARVRGAASSVVSFSAAGRTWSWPGVAGWTTVNAFGTMARHLPPVATARDLQGLPNLAARSCTTTLSLTMEAVVLSGIGGVVAPLPRGDTSCRCTSTTMPLRLTCLGPGNGGAR